MHSVKEGDIFDVSKNQSKWKGPFKFLYLKNDQCCWQNQGEKVHRFYFSCARKLCCLKSGSALLVIIDQLSVLSYILLVTGLPSARFGNRKILLEVWNNKQKTSCGWAVPSSEQLKAGYILQFAVTVFIDKCLYCMVKSCWTILIDEIK